MKNAPAALPPNVEELGAPREVLGIPAQAWRRSRAKRLESSLYARKLPIPYQTLYARKQAASSRANPRALQPKWQRNPLHYGPDSSAWVCLRTTVILIWGWSLRHDHFSVVHRCRPTKCRACPTLNRNLLFPIPRALEHASVSLYKGTVNIGAPLYRGTPYIRNFWSAG